MKKNFLLVAAIFSGFVAYAGEVNTEATAETATETEVATEHTITVLSASENSSKPSASADEKMSVKVGARVYFDGTAFFNNGENYVGSGSTISDVRIGATGKWGKFEGKIDMGFAKKAVSFKDIYLAYHFDKSSYVRVGHFAEPFGVDYMESSGNIKFVDAGIVQQAFAPGRKLGLEYIGWSKYFWYGGGVFADPNFAERLKYAGNDGYAFTARVVANPLRENGKIFHVGVAGSYRYPQAGTVAGEPRYVSYGATLGSPVNSTKYINAKVTDATGTEKVACELLGAIDRVSFQGEYIYSQTTRRGDLETFKSYGAYAQVGVVAIGDAYSYSSSWGRFALPKPGTLEFAARFSHVNLNSDDAGIHGGIQNQVTIACNYYWKPFLRFRVNYDNAHVQGLKSFNFVTGRIQLIF